MAKKGVNSDMDGDLYGGSKKGDFNTEINDSEATPAMGVANAPKKMASFKPQDDIPAAPEGDVFDEYTHGKKITDREDEYRAKRHKRMLSPERTDAFASETPAPELQTYKDVMVGQALDKEKQEVLRKIQKQKEEEATNKAGGGGDDDKAKAEKKKRRWDSSAKKDDEAKKAKEDKDKWATPIGDDDGNDTPIVLDEDDDGIAKKGGGWGATPGGPSDEMGETPTPGQWGETPTPGGPAKKKRARWDETPVTSSVDATPTDMTDFDATPGATPTGTTPGSSMTPGMTPGATPFAGMAGFSGVTGMTPGATPFGTPGMAGMETPVGLTPNFAAMTPEQIQAYRYDSEINERNAPMSDEELDAVFPQTGYEIVRPPANYQPIRKSVMSTPTPTPGGTPFFSMESPSGPSRTRCQHHQPWASCQ